MKLISPRLHGVLDYGVAAVLVGAPLWLGFSATSVPATVFAITAGVGLLVYSLLTDYAAGVRALIPFRVHLTLDALAAVAFLAAPYALGFDGVPRAFHLAVGTAVLIVVACTRAEETTARAGVPLSPAPSSAL